MKFGYRDRFDRNEVAVHDFQHGRYKQHLYDGHHVPVNEYQAMMETVPGGTEPMTETEREADWQTLQARVIEAGLTEREQVVVDCIVYGGMSLTETADYVARHESVNRALSKMQIARIRDTAFDKLRNTFSKETDNG